MKGGEMVGEMNEKGYAEEMERRGFLRTERVQEGGREGTIGMG